MASDLADFLFARIAEDEEAARAAKPGPWHWEGDKGHHGTWRLVTAEPEPEYERGLSDEGFAERLATMERRTVADGTACDDYGAQVEIDDADAAHIARHDPARVLAECEAKQRLVMRICDRHRTSRRDVTIRAMALGVDGLYTVNDGEPMTREQYERHYTEPDPYLLRPLALPYADHPDFRDEWRP